MTSKVWSLLRFVFPLCFVVWIASANSSHGRMHLHGASHAHIHRDFARNGTYSTGSNYSLSDAEEIVRQAILAAAEYNKARLENPKFNQEVPAPSPRNPELAPPLKYDGDNSTTLLRRSSYSTAYTSGYMIPPEVAEAAKIVAESTSQKPSGDQEEVATRIKEKYAHRLNDTNAPMPLRAPEGRLHAWATPELVRNASVATKRASGWWMVDMPQLGSSPFAPAGYKVWRNVMDYGAKGDGVTDDTNAINAAISDGGRCGPNCGSSTVFPAVVYFPSGTYLISSPIIQYYNTQILGDPLNLPTLLGATSFTGGSIIASDVYVSDDEEWYVNTNNFLRNVRNFKIDIRNTDPYAYVCGIHWQVAQGTSIENVEFYMQYNSDIPGNTQQGIYMENGSGGFLADLTFVGGNFGAYMGNQQFTTSHLVFVNCNTAVQIHWDWAWTMQDYIIENCGTGLIIVGGAGGPKSTGQGVGSLVLVDAIIANTANGVVTSLAAENSTSFLLQNVGFFNVETAVQDSFQGATMLSGGNQVLVDSWGFGRINNATGGSIFVNGAEIPAMTRQESLLGTAYDNMKPNLFTRRRPAYYDIPTSKVMNVKSLGAKGDGVTDDTAVLNAILDGAANTSSIVYFPFGVYVIRDTLRVPVGSRIIGQVWSQIMAMGSKFTDETQPHVAVQFGRRGDIGILEVQDMMFTVSANDGATAGAVVVEWNVHQSDTGAAGMWDSHVRVGGAEGTGLQNEQCPKKTGTVNPDCKAASLLMHLTPNSTAYLENVWVWAADHDMDKVTQDQIDVYAGRGLLIESNLAWLWGTAVEHCVIYQYQISGASNILMSMIQTESPYYQPIPQAPQPFKVGMFSNDPTFGNCTGVDCYFSWAVRIVDSSTVYILGAGLYSWFSDYGQGCVDTENCQRRGFEIVQSFDLWIYNLCTKAIVEMVSPLLTVPTLSSDNQNGFLSSVLAWLQGAEQLSGKRQFPGFHIYTTDELDQAYTLYPDVCRTALTQVVQCDDLVETFARLGYRSSLGNDTEADSVCDSGCGASLESWFNNVVSSCVGYTQDSGLPLELLGGRMWTGYNETCFIDPVSGEYCVDIIDEFGTVSSIEEMPNDELCSYCYTKHLVMMQQSAYSMYDDLYESELKYVNSHCGTTYNTTIPTSLFPAQDSVACAEELSYVTAEGDTCDSIALVHSVASAAIFMANTLSITNCSDITAGTSLCLPLPCAYTYMVQPDDTCYGIEIDHRFTYNTTNGDVRKYNPWINSDCSNLVNASDTAYGHLICLAPQNGIFNSTALTGANTRYVGNGYAYTMIYAPDDVQVAEGTTQRCGIWYVAQSDDTCVDIAHMGPTTIEILLLVNPSLGTASSTCSSNLVTGLAYCALPMYNWNFTALPGDDDETTTYTILPDPTSVPVSTSSFISATTTTSLTSSLTMTMSSLLSSTSVDTPPTSTTSNTSPTGTTDPAYHYYGCYTEGQGVRALGGNSYVDSAAMTVESCAAFCNSWEIFGVEYGSECYCGNALGMGSLVAFESECNMACSGDVGEICGAGNRLSLYGQSADPPTITPPPDLPQVSEYTYQGCFTEGDGVRALDGSSIVDGAHMTIEVCASYCLNRGYVTFGMEYSSECWCDDGLAPSSQLVAETDCSMTCSGDASESCGGPNRLNVWLWS